MGSRNAWQTSLQPRDVKVAVVRDRDEVSFGIEDATIAARRSATRCSFASLRPECVTPTWSSGIRCIPVPLPIVLGHEGSGIVEAVGERVTSLEPGDHVVLTFDSCGLCRSCQHGVAAACLNFNQLNFAGAKRDGSHALSFTLRDR